MDYRFLGKTGLKVPEISFGPGNNNVTDDGEGIALIEAAFDLGITLFDTPISKKRAKWRSGWEASLRINETRS